MDILGWLWWAIVKVVGLVWSFAWFLLGGWVATLVQLLIIVAVVFAMKYGWRRAPAVMLTRGRAAGRFAWAWARMRVPALASERGERTEVREIIRVVRAKQPGDISASTLLTVLALVGMLIAGAL